VLGILLQAAFLYELQPSLDVMPHHGIRVGDLHEGGALGGHVELEALHADIEGARAPVGFGQLLADSLGAFIRTRQNDAFLARIGFGPCGRVVRDER